MRRSLCLLVLSVVCALPLASCNKHAAGERVRGEVDRIDWRLDPSMEIGQMRGHSTGGSSAETSNLSRVLNLEAPKNFVMPGDAVERLLEKVRDAVERGGGRVTGTEQHELRYRDNPKDLDQSSSTLFKVSYQADRSTAIIVGTFVRRRYAVADSEGKEVVGQILLHLHEER